MQYNVIQEARPGVIATRPTSMLANLFRRLEAMPALYSTTIYGLVDPRTDQLRYVGKTILPLSQRLKGHLYQATKVRRRHTCVWIRSLVRAGLQPEIFEIETVGENWAEAEQFWIAYFRMIGADLTNQTTGGEGVPGLSISEETRRKMSEVQKLAQREPETARKKSVALKHRYADPEYSAKHKASVREASNRPEVKEKLARYKADPEWLMWHASRVRATFDADPERLKRRGEAISRALQTPEGKAKRSAATRKRHIEKPFTAETRAKLSKAFKGRVFSEETKRKMSEAAKRRWHGNDPT